MFRLIGGLALTLLAGCVAGSAATGAEEPAPPPEPLPDWTKEAGKRPEVGYSCSFYDDIAGEKAQLNAQVAIIGQYCGYVATPEGQKTSGSLMASFVKRKARQEVGGQVCAYVELWWGAVTCVVPAGGRKVITNPALQLETKELIIKD